MKPITDFDRTVQELSAMRADIGVTTADNMQVPRVLYRMLTILIQLAVLCTKLELRVAALETELKKHNQAHEDAAPPVVKMPPAPRSFAKRQMKANGDE